MKKWLIAAVEIIVFVVALGGGIGYVAHDGGKYGNALAILYFFAFVFAIRQSSKESRDEGIRACQELYRDRLADISHKKQMVICRINGEERTVYQSSVKVGGSTYFSPTHSCDAVKDCAECRQCALDMIAKNVKQ